MGVDHPNGIDIVPSQKRGGYDDAAGAEVVSLTDGVVFNNQLDLQIELYNVIVKNTVGNDEVGYSHVVPTPTLASANGDKVVQAGDTIGTLVSHTIDSAIEGELAHLHLSYKSATSGAYLDPSFLINQWGPENLAPTLDS